MAGRNGHERVDPELIEDLDAFLPTPIAAVKFRGTNYDVWHWKDLPAIKGFEFLDLWDQRSSGKMTAPARRKHDWRMLKILAPTMPDEAEASPGMTDYRLGRLISVATREPQESPSPPVSGESGDGSASPSPSPSTVASTPEIPSAA